MTDIGNNVLDRQRRIERVETRACESKKTPGAIRIRDPHVIETRLELGEAIDARKAFARLVDFAQPLVTGRFASQRTKRVPDDAVALRSPQSVRGMPRQARDDSSIV